MNEYMDKSNCDKLFYVKREVEAIMDFLFGGVGVYAGKTVDVYDDINTKPRREFVLFTEQEVYEKVLEFFYIDPVELEKERRTILEKEREEGSGQTLYRNNYRG